MDLHCPPGYGADPGNKSSDVDQDLLHHRRQHPPTVESPMFNWSASRWWPLRGDLDKVNSPPSRLQRTWYTIVADKMWWSLKLNHRPPGKEDSDVVTFTFTLDPKAVESDAAAGGPPAGVFLDRKEIALPVGGAFQLEALVEPFNAVNKKVTWHSSDTSVATVDTRGLVTVVGPGTAVVTVETVEGSCTATCVINGSGGEREEPVMAERPVSGVAKVETKPPQELETVEPTATTDTDNSVPKGRQQHLAKRKIWQSFLQREKKNR